MSGLQINKNGKAIRPELFGKRTPRMTKKVPESGPKLCCPHGHQCPHHLGTQDLDEPLNEGVLCDENSERAEIRSLAEARACTKAKHVAPPRPELF
jgi:hypothetical protein